MENICRTCLLSPEKLFSLTEDIALIYKIETISSIQLADNDNFPSKICGQCISNVNKLYNFRKLILSSDKEIRERYAVPQRFDYSEPKIKTEESENEDSITVENCVKMEPQQDSEYKKTENKDSITFEGCVKMELQQDNESIDDIGFDNSEPKWNDVIESNMEEPKAIDPIDILKSITPIRNAYRCSICYKVYTSRFKLYDHMLRSKHTPFSKCNICGSTVKTGSLKQHVKKHSEDPIKCKHCGKVSKNSESLRAHLRFHRDLAFPCEICGKMFKVPTQLNRHVKLHKVRDLRKWECKVCGKIFDKFKVMREHRRSTHKYRTCETCGKNFQCNRDFFMHVNLHKDPEYGKEECKICGKKVRYIKTHMSRHTDPEKGKVVCSICGKKVRYINKHMPTHTGERSHICSYCNKGFSTKSTMQRHMKGHIKEKP